MSESTPIRIVTCPACRRPTRYATENRYRPFCSARCRGIDLGAWANEDYRVEAKPPIEDDVDAADPSAE